MIDPSIYHRFQTENVKKRIFFLEFQFFSLLDVFLAIQTVKRLTAKEMAALANFLNGDFNQ